MAAAAVSGDPESIVGTTIAGKYFLHQLLGRGGMGHVYKATLLGPDRPVALKLLVDAWRGDPTLARRFEREALAASRLRHPNSIEVVDFGAADNGALYLAMEFVPGRTLAQVIELEAPLPPARAVHLLAQVLAALADAHANGVVHRDLKPANVMVDPLRDASGFVKVLDFGIATLADLDRDARLTGGDTVYGTPAYMSPEQIRGEALDGRTDLYSAGVMLFEMLSGVLPFDAPSPMAIAAKHLTDAAPRLSARRAGLAASPALEALLARALEKDPALRPASAEAMRADLEASLAALPEPARTPPRLELPRTEGFSRAGVPDLRRPSLRRRAAVMSAAAAAVAIAAWLLLAGGSDEQASGTPSSASAAAHLAISSSPAVQTAAAAAQSPTLVQAAPSAGQQRAASRPRVVPTAAERQRGAQARPDSRPKRVNIGSVRGELNAIPTPPAGSEDGVLVLVATPWANVEVDGVALGETPREVRLPAGNYGVRAMHPDLGIREGRVVVAPGERKLWAARYDP
jgi:serine/threonine protein kinase